MTLRRGGVLDLHRAVAPDDRRRQSNTRIHLSDVEVLCSHTDRKDGRLDLSHKVDIWFHEVGPLSLWVSKGFWAETPSQQPRVCGGALTRVSLRVLAPRLLIDPRHTSAGE